MEVKEVYMLTQENQIVVLADGRKLGYAEYGDLKGFPILYFHGLPGSRLEAKKLAFTAEKMQVRLIGIDRPGMGLSCIKQKRTISDWASDIAEFADALKLKTFSIIGHSGGAPYIAACARYIPERLCKAVIVSGLAPFDYPEAITSLPKSQKSMHRLARHFPMLLKLLMYMSVKALENPKHLKKMLKQLPEIDAKIFENIQFKDAMVTALKEAFRQNTLGAISDFRLAVNASSLALEEIHCPLVIFQGGMDRQVPVKHAEIYVQKVPKAEYFFLKEEGHLSILHNQAEQILSTAL
jgi:pimeloyl-ACP methyl ester carboxylesterase